MKQVTERFMEYCRFYTTSDETTGTTPSSFRQFELAKHIVSELTAIGIEACVDDKCYVYAHVPASADRAGEDALGFIAHMDTSPDAPGEGVEPIITVRDGEEIICTDRSTLLGADDKAGIAEIITAAEYLTEQGDAVSHRAMAICFTPDEEIGCGADHFDFAAFGAKEAYTVDGGALGEIEYENFNAASALVTVQGYNVHPGEAFGKMKNALLMASDFIAQMPQDEIPVKTKGYEGFYHLNDLSANESHAQVSMIIRDFDKDSFQARKQFVADLTARMNEKYGADTFSVTIKDSYYNMREKIVPDHQDLVDHAVAAMEAVGVTPKIRPIRGGTDGARLSYEGLPCPNLSTGGIGFHSVDEYIPVKSLEKMVEVVKTLVMM